MKIFLGINDSSCLPGEKATSEVNRRWLRCPDACWFQEPLGAVLNPRSSAKHHDFSFTGNAATAVKIKENKDNVKFKIRCSRFLYTLVVTEKEKVGKIKSSLPPSMFTFQYADLLTRSYCQRDQIIGLLINVAPRSACFIIDGL
ncbi:60S ribosomal protein L38 [Clonorchis sinensis]|uniref:Large ribosomal subunit protein eL38 n=1 Tax=Clonorchis sinensis TaxID=79923 RepID=A0A419PHG4_CLOSI|nr:60S ribosomal protein L38 [Clonorchis sinensis]